jgi:hypothetical protein
MQNPPAVGKRRAADSFAALNGFEADGSVCFLSNDPNFLLEDVGLIADSTLEITGEIHKLAAADVIAVLDKEKTVWDESIRRAREEAEALTREAGQIRQEPDGLKALSARAAAENAALTGKSRTLSWPPPGTRSSACNFSACRAAYDSVIHSACWRMTRPLRVVLDTTKYVWRSASRHINRLFFLAGKTLAVIRYGGVRTAAKKIRAKLFGQKPGHDGGVPVHKPVVLTESDAPEETGQTVSVVIPTKNGGGEFSLLLKNLKNQKGFVEIEHVVVDSGSRTARCSLPNGTEQRSSKSALKSSRILTRETSAQEKPRRIPLRHHAGCAAHVGRWLLHLYRALHSRPEIMAVSCAEYPRADSDLYHRAFAWNHYRYLGVLDFDAVMADPENNDPVLVRKNGQLSDITCFLRRKTLLDYPYR